MARAATGSEMVGSGQGSGRRMSVPTCCAALGKSLALSEAGFPAHQRWANDWFGRQHLLGRGGGALIGWFQGRGDGKLATGGGGVLLGSSFSSTLVYHCSEWGWQQPEKGEERRPLAQLSHPLKSVVERPRTLFQFCLLALVYKGLQLYLSPPAPSTTHYNSQNALQRGQTDALPRFGRLREAFPIPAAFHPGSISGGFTFLFRSTGLRESSPSTAP